MKIGHIADIHLGYKQSNAPIKDGLNEREADGYKAFETVIIELNKKTDIIIIAGDLFHSPNPSNYCINKAQEILSLTKKPVYIISGNHDTNDIKNEYRKRKM